MRTQPSRSLAIETQAPRRHRQRYRVGMAVVPALLICCLLAGVVSWGCTSNAGGEDRPASLERGKVYVDVTEELENRKTKELEVPKLNIAKILITRKSIVGTTASQRRALC